MGPPSFGPAGTGSPSGVSAAAVVDMDGTGAC